MKTLAPAVFDHAFGHAIAAAPLQADTVRGPAFHNAVVNPRILGAHQIDGRESKSQLGRFPLAARRNRGRTRILLAAAVDRQITKHDSYNIQAADRRKIIDDTRPMS